MGGEKKLTAKQEMFCREYMVDLNATQAAIRAGYSEKTARQLGNETLSKPYIRTRIEDLKGERMKKADISAEWVLDNLQKIVSMSTKSEPVMKWDYSQKQLVETGEYAYDSQGANRALELIGKHLGMFTDKLKLEGKVEVGVKIVDDVPKTN